MLVLEVEKNIVTAPFKCEEGEQQGAVESMPIFTFGIDDANIITNEELREHGGCLMSGADDTYIIGPSEIAFKCLKEHKKRLEEAGLELQTTKTKCYKKNQK